MHTQGHTWEILPFEILQAKTFRSPVRNLCFRRLWSCDLIVSDARSRKRSQKSAPYA